MREISKEGLKIRVGTIGIMTLEGTKMYLDQKKKIFPIPRYVYKIVEGSVQNKDEKGKKIDGSFRKISEVYLMFNNPYVTKSDIELEAREKFVNYTTEIKNINNNPDDDGCVPLGYIFKMSLENFENRLLVHADWQISG